MVKYWKQVFLSLLFIANFSALGIINEDPERCQLHTKDTEILDPSLGWLEFYKPVGRSDVLEVDYYARLHYEGINLSYSCRRNRDHLSCSRVDSSDKVIDCNFLLEGGISCRFITAYLGAGHKLTCLTAPKD